jgi:hypothetical protein
MPPSGSRSSGSKNQVGEYRREFHPDRSGWWDWIWVRSTPEVRLASRSRSPVRLKARRNKKGKAVTVPEVREPEIDWELEEKITQLEYEKEFKKRFKELHRPNPKSKKLKVKLRANKVAALVQECHQEYHQRRSQQRKAELLLTKLNAARQTVEQIRATAARAEQDAIAEAESDRAARAAKAAEDAADGDYGGSHEEDEQAEAGSTDGSDTDDTSEPTVEKYIGRRFRGYPHALDEPLPDGRNPWSRSVRHGGDQAHWWQ